MMYVDSQYVNVARKSEFLNHECTMNHLRKQVAQISKAMAWELEQHRTRLKELQKLEETFGGENQPARLPLTQSTPEETVPSSTRKATKFRKHTNRTFQKSDPALVG